MKKSILPLVLAVLAIGSASAQDQLFYAKLKTEKMPAEVVSAITEDFEDGVTITDYYAVPIEILEDDWVVTFNPENKDLTDIDYYSYDVKFSGKNVSGEAVYDANGNLISFVENVKNATLPRHIEKSIGEEFPGWAAARDHENITINKRGLKKVFYKVELTKGKEKQKVVFNGDGNLVRVGREHKMLFNHLRGGQMNG